MIGLVFPSVDHAFNRFNDLWLSDDIEMLKRRYYALNKQVDPVGLREGYEAGNQHGKRCS